MTAPSGRQTPILSASDADLDLEQAKQGTYGYVLQNLQCATRNARFVDVFGHIKCQECISKQAGFTCSFLGLRSFPLSVRGEPLPYPVFRDALDTDDDLPIFPTAFDRPLTRAVADHLKTTAARHLLPTLRRELAHAQGESTPGGQRSASAHAARVRRLLGTRTTCDGCAATILCGSWICSACGREYCLDTPPTYAYPPPASLPDSGPASAPSTPTAADEPDFFTWDKLTRCKMGGRHTAATLVPLTRTPAGEARRILHAMERWAEDHPLPSEDDEPIRLEDGWLEAHRCDSGETHERGLRWLRLDGALLPPRLDEGFGVGSHSPSEPPEKKEEPGSAGGGADTGLAAEKLSAQVHLPKRPSAPDPAQLLSTALTLSAPTPRQLELLHALRRPMEDELAGSSVRPPSHASLAWPPPLPASSKGRPPRTQTELFHALWSLGEPLVVDLAPLAPSPHPSGTTSAGAGAGLPLLPWTPRFLAQRYGAQICRVASNLYRDPLTGGDRQRETTVGEFFQAFGRKRRRGEEEGEGEGNGTDCNESRGRTDSEKIKDWPAAGDFKDEYPDLWHDFMDFLPAGSITRRDGVLNISAHMPSNANPPDLGPKGYFSEISEDGEMGTGSTKLHTVNVLLWASDAPDGTPGVAIWDLYRAEDADKIRDFLYGHLARLEGWKDADEARRKVDDPIHTQRFYLTRPLRAALFASHGVQSFRIHQKPGQAVFIPAGCAHQVCNMADCIKVATDFVSAENVARCWKVTDEFRAQTKDKVLWRSDVLQLKNMLLWAWHSAERFDNASAASQDGVTYEQTAGTSGTHTNSIDHTDSTCVGE